MHVGVLLVELDVFGLDQQPPAFRHRVASVDREVDQNLLDLARVGFHRVQLLGELHAQLDPLAQRPAQQVFELGEELAQVEQLRLDHLATTEDQQLPGQCRGALGGATDFLDVVVRGRACLQLVADELGVVHDHAEDVVEVVSDATGQLSDALQPPRPVELLLQGLLALALRPLADVANRSRGDRLPFQLDTGEADLDRELGPVPAHREKLHSGAHRPGARLVEVARPVFRVDLAEALGDEQLDQIAGQLVAGIPE
jgi:hypothetical protein